MTDVTILGAGRVGGTLAAGLARAGHDVTVGVPDPGKTRADWKGPAVSFADPAGATAASPLVINASPGETSLERLSALGEKLAGKILVDVANAALRGPGGMPGPLLYPNDSLGAKLQAALPETRVVKTLNTMLFSAMTAPGELGAGATVYLSGDDAGAKAEVAKLLGDLGWTPESILDLGGIASASGTEALFLLVPHLIKLRGFKPFAISVTG